MKWVGLMARVLPGLLISVMGVDSAGARRGGDRAGLVVIETCGVARRDEPLIAGVPVPRDWSAQSGGAFEVRAAGGELIPAQTTPLVVDDDGRVRWLRVALLADVRASGRTRLSLSPGRGRGPPLLRSPVIVTESAEAVTISTGRARVRCSRIEGALFEILFDGSTLSRSGPLASVGPIRGRIGESSLEPEPLAFRSVTVGAGGPVLASVLVEGTLLDSGRRSRLPYRCRLEVFAGREAASVALAVAMTEGPLSTGSALDVSVRLADAAQSDVGGGTSKPSPGRRAPNGTLESIALGQAADEPWLRVSRRRRSPVEPARLISEQSSDVRCAIVAEDDPFGGGRLATSNLTIALAGSRAELDRKPDPDRPLLALPDPPCLVAGAPGFAADPNARLDRGGEGLLDRAFSDQEKERAQITSLEDLGDWERSPGVFGNLEFDTIDGLVRLGVRRTSERPVILALEAFRHLEEMDCLRGSDSPFTNVLPRIHGPRHGGARVEAGHTFIEGTLELGLVTGSPEILEAGLAMASSAAARFVGDEETYRHERNVGWLLLGLSSAAEVASAELRARLRLAILEVLDRLDRRATARPGCFAIDCRADAERGGEDPPSEPSIVSVSTWVAGGVLVPGLLRASAATGDPRGTRGALGLARALRDLAIVEKRRGEEGIAFYNRIEFDRVDGSVLRRRGRVWDRNLVLLGSGLAEAAAAGRDARLRDVAERTFSTGIARTHEGRFLTGEERTKLWRGLLRRPPAVVPGARGG